ncbi:MAG TPA: cytochrome C [Desulfuromonadaceae bacterium]
MRYLLFIAASGFLLIVSGCTMLTGWKSIPPPGGCDRCHTLAISNNWQIIYQPAMVADERGRQYFQTPEYNLDLKGKQQSPLETKKVEEQACFDCHKSPSPAHRAHKGRFHH